MASSRPVTPIGIAAAELAVLDQRLQGDSGVGEPVRDGVRRALALVSGLDPYLERSTSPESDALRALAERTRSEDWGRHAAPLEQEMLSGHLEGRLLAFLVGVSGARRVLEIGLFTGYSALAMAEALPEGGDLVACEIDPVVAALAQECFQSSAAGGRITVDVGPALDTLQARATAGDAFDLVFIDADKAGYQGYLELLLSSTLLAPGGLICVDNTLLQGEPYSGESRSENGDAIALFNESVAADPRVEQVLVPVRDGLTLIRRSR